VSRSRDNIMPSRPRRKSQSGSSKAPEFTFHLIAKQAAASSTGLVAGAIVAGPVASFFDDALGTAFAGESKITPTKANTLKSTPKKTDGKPMSRRRRPPARADREFQAE
jgi:hypothetical protein